MIQSRQTKKRDEGNFKTLLIAKLNEPMSLVRAWVQNSGVAFIPTKGGGVRAFQGAPTGAGDITGYILGPGTHFEIELKAAGGRTRKAQRDRKARLEAAGCLYFHLVASEDPKLLKQSVEEAYGSIQQVAKVRRAQHAHMLQLQSIHGSPARK